MVQFKKKIDAFIQVDTNSKILFKAFVFEALNAHG